MMLIWLYNKQDDEATNGRKASVAMLDDLNFWDSDEDFLYAAGGNYALVQKVKQRKLEEILIAAGHGDVEVVSCYCSA